MKNRIYLLLAMLSGFAVSCQDEDMRYDITRPDDTMHLQVSAESVELKQELGQETAVTFTWEEASNIEPDAKVNYYFKIDIADNDFATSIDKIKIPAGEKSISFTHKKLNALLNSWKVAAGESAALEAEIIAEIEGMSYYVKPELSVVRFNVAGYAVQPHDIFVVGTAIDGMDPAKAVKMTEVVSEEQYSWSGVMKAGTYKFILGNTGLTPSYTQGTTPGSVVFNETAGNETLFSVDREGYYVLTLNIETLTTESLYPTTEYTDIWMVGAATPAGWEIMKSVKLERVPNNQVAFFYEGWLNTGEMKFPLELRDDWNVAFLMPVENGTNENGDNRMEHIETGGHDYKWNISKAGNYRVTLDTHAMTIDFEEVKQEIPSEVPYQTIWILGDATAAGWSLDEVTQQRFVYDYDAAQVGLFTWKGELKAGGTFKLPLNLDGYDNMDYLMPANVDGEGCANLTETNMQFVSRTDGKDYKWKVEANDAGEYLITLDVMNMTVDFECLSHSTATIPDDLPFKEVWMLGDATSAGWNQGQEPFSYDFNAEKGTFYWEGELKAGVFKCPTNVDDSWNITCFMPKEVEEGQDWAPLSMTEAKVVESGGDDHKWKVEESEAGNYRVELNVISNTIKFIKK